MRINVTKGISLEAISEGDILVFKDRKEIVEEVDLSSGILRTKREVNKKNLAGEEFVEYSNIREIYPTSKGEVYNWKKRLK